MTSGTASGIISANLIDEYQQSHRTATLLTWILFGAFTPVTLLFVLQRVYLRLAVRNRHLWPEDVCLLVAWICGLATQIMILVLNHQILLGIAIYVIPILYSPSSCAAKLSLLLLYRRLAPHSSSFQTLVWAVVFVVVGASLGLLGASLFPCRPIAASWDPTVPDAVCIHREALHEATTALNAITDLMVLAVPIPIVIGLQLATSIKFALCALFGTGLATVATSIVRLCYLVLTFSSLESALIFSDACIWIIIIEINLSVICAAMPTTKQFLARVWPSPHDPGSNIGRPPGSVGLVTFGGSCVKAGGGPSSHRRRPRHDRDLYSKFDDDDDDDDVAPHRGSGLVLPGAADADVEKTAASGSGSESGADELAERQLSAGRGGGSFGNETSSQRGILESNEPMAALDPGTGWRPVKLQGWRVSSPFNAK